MENENKMKREERLTFLFLSREATVRFCGSWCRGLHVLHPAFWLWKGEDRRPVLLECTVADVARSCAPLLQQWLPLSSGASWLCCILVMAGAAASSVAWFWVMALGAISRNVDLNQSFQTSRFPGKSFHSL